MLVEDCGGAWNANSAFVAPKRAAMGIEDLFAESFLQKNQLQWLL